MIESAANCKNCRMVYANMIPPENPPCEKCYVEPHEKNRDAIRIFLMVRYQLILGMSGPVDINHLAIDAAMNRESIFNKSDCFRRVTMLGRWWIDRISKRDDR